MDRKVSHIGGLRRLLLKVILGAQTQIIRPLDTIAEGAEKSGAVMNSQDPLQTILRQNHKGVFHIKIVEGPLNARIFIDLNSWIRGDKRDPITKTERTSQVSLPGHRKKT